MTAPSGPFEPSVLRQRKRRVARAAPAPAFLFAHAAEDLADRLEAIPRTFARTLTLGGAGAFARALEARPALRARLGDVFQADVSTGAVELDVERLPFAPQSFDLIVSPLTLHWANDLAGVFIQIRRALRPDGLTLASLLGGSTLQELRLALIEAEEQTRGGASLRVSPFARLEDVASLLQRAGFSLPAADRDVLNVRYAEPLALLADLRAHGETAAFAQTAPPLTRGVLMRAMHIYAQRFADPDGRVRATFEIFTATGWAPHESQQKPLKPGSAKARLADALGTAEKSAGEKAGP